MAILRRWHFLPLPAFEKIHSNFNHLAPIAVVQCWAHPCGLAKALFSFSSRSSILFNFYIRRNEFTWLYQLIFLIFINAPIEPNSLNFNILSPIGFYLFR